ncbi:hypothetical protein L0Y65_01915 [Candidatus Micrarchaeota archaeon]|nr:hypothetical protein [Candidatus Micrarchaeota archaeon]
MGDAVGAAETLIRQAHVVQQHIGPPPVAGEAQRLRSAVATATESLQRVAEQGRRVGLAAGADAESRFRDASRGFERPGRAFRTLAEARRHSREEEDSYRRQLLARHPNARPAAVQPGDYAGPADPRQAPAGSTERLSVEVAGWMDRSVLGDALAGRFARTPPLVTEDPHRLFQFEGLLTGGMSAGGMYEPGTNHIMMDADAMADASPAARRHFIAHEMMHYAAYLGGGATIRWRDGRGAAVIPSNMEFLHEGATELMAQQLSRAHGSDPGSVSYGAETTVAFYLQQIAGASVLGAAYLGGDFTSVRRAVDAKLGAGTFDRMAATGNGSGALVYLRERMQARGMGAELAVWDANPIVKTAGAID